MWHYLAIGLACAAFAFGGNAGAVWLLCQAAEEAEKKPKPPTRGRFIPALAGY